MDALMCQTCGLIIRRAPAPEVCPLCHQSSMDTAKDSIHQPGDATQFSESEKKHIPSIVVTKAATDGKEGAEVRVTVGEVVHPMTKEHYINNIDFYADDAFVARAELRPDMISPVALICLQKAAKKVTAIGHCNIHGRWISEKTI